MTNEELTFEETKKRLNKIMEFTIAPSTVYEEDNNQDPNAMGGAPDQGGMGGDPNMMGGDPNAMGGMPDQGGMGGDPNMMGGDPNAMGGAPDQGGTGGDPNMMGGGQGGPEGFDPQIDQNQSVFDGVDNSTDDGVGPDDDVVDISDLTDSQEDIEKDIDKLDNKFSKLMKQLGAFEELIRQNDEKIESLKSEFEKRNPTQIEKLSMQTAHSYPFNQTVDDYWKQKEATSNYSTESDNNGKEQGQYVITKDDVNGSVDWKSIADSLDDDDFLYNQTLDGVLKI